MLGHSHAISGALAWAAAAPSLAYPVLGTHLSTSAVLAGTMIAAGAALLPDLDHQDGTIANFLGPISELLCRVVHRISGGHRHATHSLLFVALTGFGTWAGERAGGRGFTIGLVFVLLALAARALHLCPPGRGVHAWGVILVEAAFGTWAIDHALPSAPTWLPYAVALGALAHLVGDCLTKQGCPLLWPHQERYEFVLISHTGNRMETLVFAPLMAVGTLMLLWFNTLAPSMRR